MARAALATLLNAIVLAPAVALGDAGPAATISFLVLASAFSWFEARGGEALDLADGGFPWSALATALMTLAVFWLAALTALPSAPTLWLGAGLMAVGVALRHLAMRALGRAFVSEPRVQAKLVEHGVYRRMRHPSEAGLLALTLGAALLFGSITATLAWVLVLVPLIVIRVRAEDRELSRWFGPAHADYRRRVRTFG